jgi:hypothetical protein
VEEAGCPRTPSSRGSGKAEHRSLAERAAFAILAADGKPVRRVALGMWPLLTLSERCVCHSRGGLRLGSSRGKGSDPQGWSALTPPSTEGPRRMPGALGPPRGRRRTRLDARRHVSPRGAGGDRIQSSGWTNTLRLDATHSRPRRLVIPYGAGLLPVYHTIPTNASARRVGALWLCLGDKEGPGQASGSAQPASSNGSGARESQSIGPGITGGLRRAATPMPPCARRGPHL